MQARAFARSWWAIISTIVLVIVVLHDSRATALGAGIASGPPEWITLERITSVASDPRNLGVTFSTDEIYEYGVAGKLPRPVPTRLKLTSPSHVAVQVTALVNCSDKEQM